MEQTTRTHNLSKRLLSILLAAVMCLSTQMILISVLPKVVAANVATLTDPESEFELPATDTTKEQQDTEEVIPEDTLPVGYEVPVPLNNM